MHPRLVLSVAIACLVWAPCAAADDEGPALTSGRTLKPAPSGEAARQQAPLYLRADELRGRPNAEVQALGNVELRQAGVVIRADQLRYDQAEDLAVAQGKVRISFEGSAFSGPEVRLKVQRMEGVVLQPEYQFAATGAGGRADRVDILGPGQSRVINGNYTSCQRDGADNPDWILSARQLDLDLDAGVGVAEGAVLRFFDMPILVLPTLSFPVERSAQVRLAAADPGLHHRQRHRARRALLLEHCAEPRRDDCAVDLDAPRLRGERRVALP